MEGVSATRPQGSPLVNEDIEMIPADVEEALRLQDEALALLERLRTTSSFRRNRKDRGPEKRRQFRRWPAPPNLVLELHDGKAWNRIAVLDIGVGGARIEALPRWMQGPAPCRLSAPAVEGVLVLADIMWRTGPQGGAGIRFEFDDPEEREVWSDGLIDALLAQHAVS